MNAVDHKRRRYQLHAWRRFNWQRLGAPAARGCMTPLESNVVVHISEGGAHHVGGIKRCGSVHACPVCAPTVRSHRALEIQQAVDSWIGQGNTVWFLTATIPHRAGDPLDGLLDQLQAMWSEAWAGKAGKAARDACGIVGTIRALEVTYGRNGWHPHIHALVFVAGNGFDVARAAGRWRSRFDAHGIGDRYVPRVSFDARQVVDRGSIDGYVAGLERGWGAGVELARADLKGTGGVSVPQLLELASTGERKWVRRWAEYEAATRGRRFMVWSRGLRDLTGLTEPERTDEEAAAGPEPVVVVASWIVPSQVWNRARSAGTLGQLLHDLVRCEGHRWGGHLIRPAPPPRASSHSTTRPQALASSYQPKAA